MDIAIDEALKKGIEAHQTGNTRDADSYFRAILVTQPEHPDANHNLAIVLLGTGRTEKSLQHFKKAIESSPSADQYWFSYATALIQADQRKEAGNVVQEAIEKGIKKEVFDPLQKYLQTTKSANGKEPSESESRKLIDLFNLGELKALLEESESMLLKFPKSNFLVNMLGGTYIRLERYDDAIQICRKSIELNTEMPDVYNNLGIALREKGERRGSR